VLGRRSPNGFWYYYPVALAAKTPIPMLIALAIAIVMGARSGFVLDCRSRFPPAFCCSP